MKVADQSAVPVPERKPVVPPAVADSDTGGFGTAMASFGGPVVPGIKPEPPALVLPGLKPEPPPLVLPDVKPEPPAIAWSGVLPVEKPPVPAGVVSPAQSSAVAWSGVLPLEKPSVPVGAMSPADQIRLASKQVANISGHSYAAILAQATQESDLDPKTKSRTSSAAGPFQFLDRTWLGLMRRYGAAYGLGDLANQIVSHNGLASVKDPKVRKQILDLRYDVNLAAGMAGRYLAEGRERLQRSMGRPVSETESRIAYIMGVGGASKLLRAAAKGDATPAADLLPAAARANGPLFYDKASGRALTAAETVARLSRRMETDQKALFAAIDRAAEQPVVLDGAASKLGAFRSV